MAKYYQAETNGNCFLENIKLSPEFRNGIHSRLNDSTPTSTVRESSRRKKHKHSASRSGSSYEENDTSQSSHDSSFHELLNLTDYNNSPATTPSGRDTKVGWYDMHERHVSLSRSTQSQLTLIGDSIIAGLSRYPKVWQGYFRPHRALNFGIGGDRTQHVLWRAENIELPHSTKYLVIHCGTNNIDRDSPRDIANGIISIGLTLQEKCKGLRVVVTGILPRDLDWSYRREKILETNKYLKTFCSKKLTDFYFMKQDDDWTFEDGKLNTEYYYSDYLHLIETGNDKFAKCIIKMISKLINKEEIDYSSEDGDVCNGNSVERKHGKKRKRRESPQKYQNITTATERKRKRHSNESVDEHYKSKHASQFKWSKHSADHRSPAKWSSARKWSKVIKKEHHEKFKKLDQVESPTKTDLTITDDDVTSIDISLADDERKAARLAKFGPKDLNQISLLSKSKINATTPSSLVLKIRQSQEEQRKKLAQQRRLSASLVNYTSPSSSQDDSAVVNDGDKFSKKLFTDYGSASDSE